MRWTPGRSLGTGVGSAYCILCDARLAPTPPRTDHSMRARRWWRGEMRAGIIVDWGKEGKKRKMLVGCLVRVCVWFAVSSRQPKSHLDKPRSPAGPRKRACRSGLVAFSGVHGIGQAAGGSRHNNDSSSHCQSVHVVVGREDAGVGGLCGEHPATQTEASRSHRIINQSCSALPQTETPSIRPN